jgi:site-specific DNA-methyltransferase (adenine-specific)
MKDFEDNTFDSVVTDPPYGLRFMGKGWDHGVPGVDYWKEVLRVAKPGAFLLAFGGTRTFHRLAVAIEDAGWEIRDTIGWIYGSGFPKSHNIGKAVDKLQGNEREVIGRNPNSRENCDKSNTLYESGTVGKTDIFTKGTSEWEGWGTALKPAWEPIIMARKPFNGTVAENVLKYGTGGINIDECRVGFVDEADKNESVNKNQHSDYNSNNGVRVPTKGIYHGDFRPPENYNPTKGRFPANIIHDGSEEVLDIFPNTKSGGGEFNKHDYADNINGSTNFQRGNYVGRNDGGCASRFFYCAKASKQDRNEGVELNNHPTVKPTSLMRYLVKLVTRKSGLVLDPFCGSGSTCKACVLEGCNYVGIDLDPEYCKIAENRTNAISIQTKLW